MHVLQARLARNNRCLVITVRVRPFPSRADLGVFLYLLQAKNIWGGASHHTTDALEVVLSV
jgi:hypothetical protein